MDDKTARHDYTVPKPHTDRTRIRRHSDRAVPDRIEEFLRAGLVAHVAYVDGGEPRTIPFFYHYEAGHVYIHGSAGNGTLRALEDGRPVAVSIASSTPWSPPRPGPTIRPTTAAWSFSELPPGFRPDPQAPHS